LSIHLIEQWKQRVGQLKVEAYTLYLAYKDPRVPWYARAFAAYVVARTFSPIDLIPDFIPVLGYLDDLVLTPLGIALALRMIPRAVLDESRERAREVVRQGTPKNWIAAGIVIVVWLLLIAVVIRAVVRAIDR